MKIENKYLYFMNKHQISVRILSTQYETFKIRFFKVIGRKMNTNISDTHYFNVDFNSQYTTQTFVYYCILWTDAQ
jgi:hypothetical protein